MPADRRSLLIVGSGVFGTSTALSFLEEGGWDVRVIDRVRRSRRRAGGRVTPRAHDPTTLGS
jgi:2-polyprenyl-6-methoxyphenol hydroxylase-like FAD-dependent oxidoreductase